MKMGRMEGEARGGWAESKTSHCGSMDGVQTGFYYFGVWPPAVQPVTEAQRITRRRQRGPMASGGGGPAQFLEVKTH